MTDILVTRNIAGHRRGDVVQGVDLKNDLRYAGHVDAGNAVVLAPAVDEVADEALKDLDLEPASWVHPDEDYAPVHLEDEEDAED